ncbi:MAG TPA: hypothetical protein VES69_12115 [Pyrinomonadaceae bacterium]|nr:hypothetical protein [Pyrinomonadaceae bacterium]
MENQAFMIRPALWSAVASGARNRFGSSIKIASKAPSPLRSAGALQRLQLTACSGYDVGDDEIKWKME